MTITADTLNRLNYGLASTGAGAEVAAILNSGGLGANGLTGFAGGGQANGTALVAGVNRATTVATIGDSFKLPLSVAGSSVTFINSGAQPADVFPFLGDAINLLAVNTALRMNISTAITFWCAVAGTWNTHAMIVPPAKFTTNAVAGPTTGVAGEMSGAAYVTAEYTNVGANTLTTRTATQLFADQGNVQPGDGYMLLIRNVNAGQITLTAGAGVTITGTATIAANTARLFHVKFTTATALVMTNVGGGIAV